MACSATQAPPLFVAVLLVGQLVLAGGLQAPGCTAGGRFGTVYDGLRDTLEHFAGLYGDFARARPKVVADHVKAVQVNALAQDFFAVLEAFRVLSCLALCPQSCLDPAETRVDALGRVQLAERLNNLQLDVELVADDPNFAFLAGAQSLLREAKQHATMVLATVSHSSSGALDVDWEESLRLCVATVMSRLMFPVMKVVSLAGKDNHSHVILHGVSLDPSNPASTSGSYISPPPPRGADAGGDDAGLAAPPDGPGELSFSMLRSLATRGRSLRLSLGPIASSEGLCHAATSPYLAGDALASAAPWPLRWRLPPRAGEPRTPKVVELLEQVEARVLDLSHNFLVLRPTRGPGWMGGLRCEGVGLDFDPTLCLEHRGWGGSVYSLNIHPPFRAELQVLGRRLGDASQVAETSYMNLQRPYPGLEDSGTFSLEHLLYRVDLIWRQESESSPDVFFLHPAVHNCHALQYLFSGTPIKPKVLIIPVNPLVPPPFEVMPRAEVWWHLLRERLRASPVTRAWVAHEEDGEGAQGDGDEAQEEPKPAVDVEDDLAPAFWFAQCSLAAVGEVLQVLAKKKFQYVLHHLDGPYAVYVREDLRKALAVDREVPDADPDAFDMWLKSWFCYPGSRFFSKLELFAGPEIARLTDPAASRKDKEATLCRFLDRHRIPVQRRNFDCAGVPLHPGLALAGARSCLRANLRGWGNDADVTDSEQDSAVACEARCALQNCSYWTYDPTAMYGLRLCWVWTGGRPAEVKSQEGWVSGDADCHRANVANSSGAEEPPGEEAPMVVGDGGTPEGAAAKATATALGSHRKELLRQWAVLQPKELPGMRYFVESGGRGRCVEGFCECFPPYRGPLCEQLDPGAHDGERNFSGVLHYLTSDDDADIDDIEHSLPRLWRQYNRRFDYPVVIFNDGLSEEHRERIVRASDNRIWFAYVDDYLDVPDMITKDPERRAMLDEVKWSVGYRGMCRFRSGTIFLQPVLRGFQYAMTLDTDGYFPAEVAYDPIATMHEGEYVYTFSHLLPDLPGAVRHFWDYSLMYMRMRGIHPRSTSILRQFVREADLQWTCWLYMNDIEIVQLDWFRSDPYQDYFRYLDSVGGFWLHRWGDHAVRTIAVGMWLPEEKVYEMDIPYGHQNYCRCSKAHEDLQCMREGDVGGVPASWWTCAKAGADSAASKDAAENATVVA